MYLLKAHVSATSYVNEHGTAVNRKEHEDSRASALESLRSHQDSRVRSYARKLVGSKDSYDLHQIRRDRFGHLPQWNSLDDHTRQAILDAEEEKSKGHKEFEEWVEKHGSKKGTKKESVKVDRSGWEQQLMFKGKPNIMYLLRKSQMAFDFSAPKHEEERTVHATTRHMQSGAVAQVKEHQRRTMVATPSQKREQAATAKNAEVFAVRQERAREDFAEALQNMAGITKEQADRITQYYLDKKLATMDSVNGTIRAKHGVYLDPDAIRRAVELSQPGQKPQYKPEASAQKTITEPELVAKYNLDAMHPELVPTVKEIVGKIQRDFGVPEISVDMNMTVHPRAAGTALWQNINLSGKNSNKEYELENAKAGKSHKLDWVTAHEFGHVIDQLIQEAHGKEGEKNSGYDSAIRKIKADHKKDPKHSNLVTAYSMKNNQEYVAEHFADAIINGDKAHPYSKKVYQTMKEWYTKNKYKGFREAHAGWKKDKEEERARIEARRASMVQPGEHPGNGSIVEDSSGKQYLVMMARNSIVNVAPIINGKAEVNRDSIISFSTDRDFVPASDSTRYIKLFKTGRNYYEEQEASKESAVPPKFEAPIMEVPKRKQRTKPEPKPTPEHHIAKVDDPDGGHGHFVIFDKDRKAVEIPNEHGEIEAAWPRLLDATRALDRHKGVTHKQVKVARGEYDMHKSIAHPVSLIKSRKLHGSINFNGLEISIETGRSRCREWYNSHDGSQGMSRMTTILNAPSQDLHLRWTEHT